MKNLKKSHLVLIAVSILILLGCIGLTAFLLFSNYQNVRIFKSAQNNLARGSAESLLLAEAQLLQVVSQDADNEAAYMMLAQIAAQRKAYSEQVYYSYMAHRLNPLSEKNKAVYIKSLSMARYFDRLENFLAQQQELSDEFYQLLLYAAGHNGNINKYKHKLARRGDNRVAELAFLLFKYKHLSSDRKLSALQNNFSGSENAFLRQELLAAQVELYLAKQDIDNAEKALQQAYELNKFAFAPVLGRFYAEYRTFGRALQIFEKYLADYHDPMVAMQTAEIYCLLNHTAKIAGLRKNFQADAGNMAMFCCYYFDALTALAQGDMAALKELTMPLRNSIKTPLAAYMFFCSDLHNGDLSSVQESYAEFLACKPYLDLQKRANDMLSAYLKKSFSAAPAQAEKLLPLALRLYERKPEVFTAKLILLIQKRSGGLDIRFLRDALKLFNDDQGLLKIAIEYFLSRDQQLCGKLIADYRKKFPAQRGDMLRYEIVLSMKNKDYDRVSALFRANLAPEILPEYWILPAHLCGKMICAFSVKINFMNHSAMLCC